jgi:hypothetical protein
MESVSRKPTFILEKLRFWTALAIWPEHRKLARYTHNQFLPLMNAGDSGSWPTLSRSLPHAAAK